MTVTDLPARIDLTGGFAPSEDLMRPDIPKDDPHYRESVSMWFFDDAGQIQFPRFLMEDIAGEPNHRLTFYNIAFPNGRSLVEWGEAPSLPMLDEAGRPTIYGAGGMRFRCVEPFKRWTASFRGEMFDTRPRDLMRGPPAGPRVPVDLEIDTTSVAPPWSLKPELMAAKAQESLFVGRGFRYEQLMRVEGACTVGGERYAFKGRGLRIHRRSSRVSAGFPGHVWQTTVFPDGTAFGYTAFLPGDPSSFCEGFYFDGRRMTPARPKNIPWMTLASAEPQDVGFTLVTEVGELTISAETQATNFSTVRAASSHAADPLLQQQGAALYRLNGQAAFGMIERSNARSRLTLAP
jgi:hypothetical protein